MHAYQRIDADRALRHAVSGQGLLVNAYSEPEKWKQTRVPGAAPYYELRDSLGELPKDKELLLYCG